MTQEQRSAEFRGLLESGVISDKEKFDKWSEAQSERMKPEEKALMEDVSNRSKAFREKAVNEFRALNVLGTDTSSPDARRIINGINEVAQDYAMNYSKIAGDTT